jgi:hypothetical protein
MLSPRLPALPSLPPTTEAQPSQHVQPVSPRSQQPKPNSIYHLTKAAQQSANPNASTKPVTNTNTNTNSNSNASAFVPPISPNANSKDAEIQARLGKAVERALSPRGPLPSNRFSAPSPKNVVKKEEPAQVRMNGSVTRFLLFVVVSFLGLFYRYKLSLCFFAQVISLRPSRSHHGSKRCSTRSKLSGTAPTRRPGRSRRRSRTRSSSASRYYIICLFVWLVICLLGCLVVWLVV